MAISSQRRRLVGYSLYKFYLCTWKISFIPPNKELDRIRGAMRKEEFRKLLVEYAEEISNPENKKIYEEEIIRLERERGQDVKFINPIVRQQHTLLVDTHPSICCSVSCGQIQRIAAILPLVSKSIGIFRC